MIRDFFTKYVITCNIIILVITDTDAFTVARNEEASGKKNIEAQTWDDLHVYTITCLEEGSGMFAVMVGNQITEQTIDQ